MVVFFTFVFIVKDQLEFITSFFSDEAAVKILEYLESDRLNINWIIAQSITTIIFPSLFLFLYKLRKDNRDIEYMMVMYIIMGIGIIPLKLIFSRFSNYFVFFYILMLAELLPLYKKSILRQIYFVIIFVFCVFTFYLSYFIPVKVFEENTRQYSRWYPYSPIIDKEKYKIRELRFENGI